VQHIQDYRLPGRPCCSHAENKDTGYGRAIQNDQETQIIVPGEGH